jgi:hypothetical protein
MQTKAGLKLRSQTCTTEVIVVRAATDPVDLTCCGAPMTTDEVGEVPTGSGDEILLGKRYTDEETGLEVLCTKPGFGPLAADGRALLLKGTKPLPSSD